MLVYDDLASCEELAVRRNGLARSETHDIANRKHIAAYTLVLAVASDGVSRDPPLTVPTADKSRRNTYPRAENKPHNCRDDHRSCGSGLGEHLSRDGGDYQDGNAEEREIILAKKERKRCTVIPHGIPAVALYAVGGTPRIESALIRADLLHSLHGIHLMPLAVCSHSGSRLLSDVM